MFIDNEPQHDTDSMEARQYLSSRFASKLGNMPTRNAVAPELKTNPFSREGLKEFLDFKYKVLLPMAQPPLQQRPDPFDKYYHPNGSTTL